MNEQQQAPHPLTMADAYLEILKPHAGKLTDIQLDQIEIACHVFANLCVQLGIGTEQKVVEFEIGEPAEQSITPAGSESFWQRTTVIDKVQIADGTFEYMTAATGREDWIHASQLRKRQA